MNSFYDTRLDYSLHTHFVYKFHNITYNFNDEISIFGINFQFQYPKIVKK